MFESPLGTCFFDGKSMIVTRCFWIWRGKTMGFQSFCDLLRFFLHDFQQVLRDVATTIASKYTASIYTLRPYILNCGCLRAVFVCWYMGKKVKTGSPELHKLTFFYLDNDRSKMYKGKPRRF